ncbi:helix-turn-helix domain-containing protein [Sorangium sp. So ce887]
MADGAPPLTRRLDAALRQDGVGVPHAEREALALPLLVRETGLSFGRWRQQLHIILALQRFSRGASVQSVANDLGYESASSFVTMFRKALGTSPARYMTGRLEFGAREEAKPERARPQKKRARAVRA